MIHPAQIRLLMLPTLLIHTAFFAIGEFARINTLYNTESIILNIIIKFNVINRHNYLDITFLIIFLGYIISFIYGLFFYDGSNG